MHATTALSPSLLGVLDLASIPDRGTSAMALANSLELAVETERLGYGRYWIAEHHGSVYSAASSPAVVLAAVASRTSRIRVGSGAVLLPVHSPYLVAEQFGTLHALYGDRIDLGIGRSTGSSETEARLMRGTSAAPASHEFEDKLDQLFALFLGPIEVSGKFAMAIPGFMNSPEIWLLGSSTKSAAVAARKGLRFAFAHHFDGRDTAAALDIYRREFRPSETLAEPYCAISICVACDDDSKALKWQLGPEAMRLAMFRNGLGTYNASAAVAATYRFDAADLEYLRDYFSRQAIGTPAVATAQISHLKEKLEFDEAILVPMSIDHDHRVQTLSQILDGAHRSAP